MEFQRNPCLKLMIVLVVMFKCVHSQVAGTDCNGKKFYCLDDQQFQVCKRLSPGNSETIDDKAYPCPTDLFCDNADKSACDSQTSLTTTTVAPTSTTTAAPSTTTTSTTTEAPFTCTQPGVFPNENDCHRYYTCTQLTWALLKTESSCLGMAFDPVSQSCTNDLSPCPSTFTCQSSGQFPDPADRANYFWCLESGSGYTMYHLYCGFGLAFDPTNEQCSSLILQIGGTT